MKKTLLFLAFVILAALPLKAQVIGQPVTIVNTAPGACTTNIDLAQEYQGVIYICVGGNYAAVSTTAAGGSISGLTATRVPVAASATTLTDYAGFTHDGTTLTVAGLKDTALTSGRVPFATTGGLVTDDSNLVWDNTNKRLGISIAPSSPLHIESVNQNGLRISRASATAGSYEFYVRSDGAFAYYDNISMAVRLILQQDGTFVVGPTTNTLGQFAILNTSTTRNALYIKAVASQSADIVGLFNSAGTQIGMRARSDGILSVGTETTNTVYAGSSGVANIIGPSGYWGIRTNSAFDFNIDKYNGGSPMAAFTILESAGKIGINSTSPGAQLQITPSSSSTIGQIIKLAPSQSADALQVQNSSGTVLAKIDASGALTLSSNGSSIFLNVPASGAMRTGSAGTSVYLDFGNTYFRDGNGGNSGMLHAFGLNIRDGGGTSKYTYSSTITSLSIASDVMLKFVNSNDASSGTSDLGLYRNAAGVLEINSGTAGTYRDLYLRYLGAGTAPSSTYQIRAINLQTTGTSGSFYGISGEVSTTPSGSSTHTVYGLNGLATWLGNTSSGSAYNIAILGSAYAPGAGTLGHNYGFYLTASNNGAGTINDNAGGYFLVDNTGGGTNSTSRGVYTKATVSGGSTTSSHRAFEVGTPSVSASTLTDNRGLYVANGAGTTNYAVYIGNQTGGSTNYAFWSDGGASVLNAGTSTVVPLTLKGAASQTGDHLQMQTSAGVAQYSFNINTSTNINTMTFLGGSSQALGNHLMAFQNSSAVTLFKIGVDANGSIIQSITSASSPVWMGNTNGFTFASTRHLMWTAGDSNAAADTNVSRVSAGVVGIGTGTTGSVAGTLQLTTLQFASNQINITGVSTTEMDFQVANSRRFSIQNGNTAVLVGSGWMYGFSSNTDPGAAGQDTAFSRLSAGVIGVGTGALSSVAGSMSMTNLTLAGNFFAGPSTIESFTTNASALGTLNYYTDSQTIYYDTAAATGNVTVAVKAAAGTNLDTRLATGQAVTIVLKVTNTGTAYNIAALTIDGGAQTIKWLNGSAPAGNINAVDTYTFYIYKTGSATFYVEGTQQSYK